MQTFEWVRRIGSIRSWKSVFSRRILDRVALFLFYLKQAVEPSLQHNKRGRDNVPATHTHHYRHPSTLALTATDFVIKHCYTTRQNAKRHSQNVIKCSRTGCRWRVIADRTGNHALCYCFRHMVTEATRSDRRKGRKQLHDRAVYLRPPLTTWMMRCASVSGNREGGRTCALSIFRDHCRCRVLGSSCLFDCFEISLFRDVTAHYAHYASRFCCRTDFHFYQRKYGPGHAFMAEVLVRRSRKNVHRKHNE